MRILKSIGNVIGALITGALFILAVSGITAAIYFTIIN